MSRLLGALQTVLEGDGWSCMAMDDGRLQTNCQGENGQWPCIAEAMDERGLLMFYSLLPVKVPADRQAAVAEFLTRANAITLMGTLQMDYETGEVSCRTSLDDGGQPIPPGTLRSLIYANILMMDRYLPGLLELAYSSASPADVFQKAEADDDMGDDDDDDDDEVEAL